MADFDREQEQLDSWERKTLKELIFASHKMQRRQLFWSRVFKALFLAYLVWIAILLMPSDTTGIGKTGAHTAVIQVNGEIGANKDASADNIVNGLRTAFDNKNTKGVVIRINSPGGSAVQAFYVYDELVRLRAMHPEIKVYAVIADIGASGGYFIAAGADEIYANKASLVGSIGAVLNGFGFVDTMDKLGVERRMITAGEHKGFLDPFSPINTDDVKFAEQLVANVHKQFIEVVKDSRGEKLNDSATNLFSGLVWTGEQALELGLIDGYGSTGYVARELIGVSDIVDYSAKGGFFDRFSDKFGVLSDSLARLVGTKTSSLSIS